MTAEECARIMIKAIARRKREEVMTLRGKLGQWAKLIAPGLVDRDGAQSDRGGQMTAE